MLYVNACFWSKKERPVKCLTGLVIPGDTYSHRIATTIGLTSLASEFGKGSGVSPSVNSPGNSLSPAFAGYVFNCQLIV